MNKRRYVLAAAALCVSIPALAHHGLGRFDRTKPVEIAGVIKSIDFVNPHSYLNLDVTGADGKTIAMRCEMRAATLLRRSGWSEEMFVAGAQAKIFGFGHRDDPASCYLEDITIGDAPTRSTLQHAAARIAARLRIGGRSARSSSDR